MYGHVETDVERMRHLDLLRSIQRETGGFTEFVPLSFVHEEAPMTLRQQLPELRPGPTGDDVIRLYAIARLMLGSTIRNLQVSWVKDGMRQAQWLLVVRGQRLRRARSSTRASPPRRARPTASSRRPPRCGAPSATRGASPSSGARATTCSAPSRPRPAPDERDPLDGVDDPEAIFGSYDRLTRDERFRFRLPVAAP